MSVESTFKNYIDLDSPMNKQLQQTISHRDAEIKARNSFKTASRERHRNAPPKTRNRTTSAAASAENHTTHISDLLLKPIKTDEKNDRRYSDLKASAEQRDPSTLERYSSIPHLHYSLAQPHTHRTMKSNHRTQSRDETNLLQITINHVNVSNNQLADTSPTKIDPPFALKSPTLPMRSTRLLSTMSNGSSGLGQSDGSSLSSLFTFEEHSTEPRSVELFIVESRTPICVSETYHEHFFEHFHTNYYGEYDDEGPFIASVRCSYQKTSLGEVCEARAIIRTPYRNCDVSDVVTEGNESNILQMLFNKINLPPIRSYGTIGDPKANEKIYLFDKSNDERYSCKIGVIYQRVNQTDEYEIFSNDSASQDMFDFLDILAERVQLKGFSKYRGDLDTKSDLNGEFSYYANYRNHEIMFNVAPLVPCSKANSQCVERKGLVGNAFVCIVFQEPDAVFVPDYISGKVTQIYITVQPVNLADGLYYKVGIWRRNEITALVDPPGGVFKYDRSFVSYFLTLLLNAVNVAVESPSLRTRIYEQRLRIKLGELKRLSDLFGRGPIPDFATDADNGQNNSEIRRENSSGSTTHSVVALLTTTAGILPSPSPPPPPPPPPPPLPDSMLLNTRRVSPTPSRRRVFSKRLFDVFSGRSGSISSSTPPSTHTNHTDTTPSSPQSAGSREATRSISRPNNRPVNEGLTRKRSLKNTSAPTVPMRPTSTEFPPTISLHTPSSSSILLSNPFQLHSQQDNLINDAALNVTTRNRSNSSPEQTIPYIKSLSNTGSKVTDDGSTTNSSSEQTNSGDSSEDETVPTQPFQFS